MPYRRRSILNLIPGTVLVLLLSACGNITPSIQKNAMADHERAQAAEAERDAKAERERAAAADREVEEDRAAPLTKTVEVRVELKKNRDKALKSVSAAEGSQLVMLEDADRKGFVGPSANAPIVPDVKLPANYTVILHLFVERAADQKALKAADLDVDFESSTKNKSTAYALRLNGCGTDRKFRARTTPRRGDRGRVQTTRYGRRLVSRPVSPFHFWRSLFPLTVVEKARLIPISIRLFSLAKGKITSPKSEKTYRTRH